MELYFSPMSCSLATRAALYEANAHATFTYVDSQTKRTEHGDDFLKLNPLGLVPTLRLDDGSLLTENASILQHVAARYPAAALAPSDARGVTRLQEWLSFIGTELHKALFAPLFDAAAPEAARSYALEKGSTRLDHLASRLQGREFLLDRFSVADAYLTTVLNWTRVTPIDLKRWPSVQAYVDRVRARPAYARALAEELELYRAELARRKSA
jgi:glutathione S-transferase